jgi:hypothetical protein
MTTKLDVDVSFIIPKVDDEKRPMDWRRERETERLEDGRTLIWTLARIFRAKYSDGAEHST